MYACPSSWYDNEQLGEVPTLWDYAKLLVNNIKAKSLSI